MPAALLKQSKGLRFFTLRRRDRPLSEIVPAAVKADACIFAVRRTARAAARISMPFRKTGVTPARSSPPPTAANCKLLPARFREQPKKNEETILRPSPRLLPIAARQRRPTLRRLHPRATRDRETNYLTVLTIASNALGSFIARSARTLRFRAMPLALTLPINSE